MYRNVIDRRLRIKFSVILSLSVLLTALASAAFFYLVIQTGLGETYAQKIAAINQLKTAVMKHSLLIYVLFALLTAVAIILAVVLYTHRIVGPLVRVRSAARQLSEGNLEVTVRFREKDAVNSLADALNNLSFGYRQRYSLIAEALEEMRKDAEIMSGFIKKGDTGAAEKVRERIQAKAAQIHKTLSGIKL